MPLTNVVSDASVALKWFHSEGEEEVDAARAILDAYRSHSITLHVLDLTPYEIGNALLRGRHNLGADRTATVLASLDTICPRVCPSAAELREAAALAESHELTLYDAAYAAVARARGAQLATLDQDLLRAGLGRRPSEIVAQLSVSEFE
jgi:predicted nucleic acid-binding protein